MVTCTSPLSRNFQLGFRVGKGNTLEEAMEQLGRLAEGVNTLRVIRAKTTELGVYMPLVEGLHRVLYEGYGIGQVVNDLMTSEQMVDVEFASPETWSSA